MSTSSANDTPIKTFKRPYKKSRQGCNTCKARRVKCDEVHPICGQCTKRFRDLKSCDFESSVQNVVSTTRHRIRALQPRPSAITQLQPTIRQRPTGTDVSDPSHMLELRLMHHYARITCDLPRRGAKVALPVAPYPMWETDMPQLAFSSDLVLNGLLAVSSLHYLALTPDDRTLAHASRFYLDKTVKKYRMALADTENRNLQSLIATAILLIHHTWLTAHYNDNKEPFTMSKHLTTFRMCEGLKVLDGEVFAEDEALPENEPASKSDEAVVCQYPGYKYAALEDLAILSERFNDGTVVLEDRYVYERTAEDLALTYSLIASGAKDVSFIEHEIATVLHRLPPRFITLLERGKPIALALLARSIALLKVFDDDTAWWVHGAGECQVALGAVRGMRSLVPADWLWAMEWPRKIVAGEVKLDGVYEMTATQI